MMSRDAFFAICAAFSRSSRFVGKDCLSLERLVHSAKSA